jgi:type III secretion protein U
VSGNRTEAPTPRRLREARRRGDVARSFELSGAAALAGGAVALAATGPWMVSEAARALRAGLAAAVAGGTEPGPALAWAFGAVARLSALPCAAALAAGGAAAFLQVGPGLSPEALRPRLDRLDPLKGLRRLASPEVLLRAALGMAKAALLLVLLWMSIRSAIPSLAQLPRLSAPALWRALSPLGDLLARSAALLLAFGLADLLVVRARHRRALKMTRDEVRREHREDEGDPLHREERRRLHRAALEAAPVSRATCVVVNPTHLAIALLHDRALEDAPRVLAKGAGAAAARIRSAARRAGVPVVRDVPLARALWRLAEVGEEIPEDLYEAAAAVLAHLYGAEERR